MGGGIDWGAVAASGGSAEPSGSGIDWGKHSDLPAARGGSKDPYAGILAGGGAARRSSGGGGFLSSVEGALAPAAHFAENLGIDVGTGVYNAGHAAVRDVVNHPASLIGGPTAPLTASSISLLEGGGGGHLAHDVVDPIGEAYAHKYAPIVEHPLTGKSYTGVRKDPFGTALDLASLISIPFTAGSSAALRGGALAERLGATADDLTLAGKLIRAGERARPARAPLEREALLGSDEARTGVPYSVERAKTPYGRLAQKGYLKAIESPRLVESPIGAKRLVARGLRQRVALADLPRSAQLNEYEKSIPLGSARQTALHIAAQAPRQVASSDWRRLFEDFYARRATDPELGEGGRLDAEHMLKVLGAGNAKRAAAIDKVLTNPDRNFLRFYERARGVSEDTSRGLGTPAEASADRAIRPADILAGTRWEPAEGSAASGARVDGEFVGPTADTPGVFAKYTPAEPAENPFGEPFIFSHLHAGRERLNTATLTRTSMPLGQIQAPTVSKLNRMVRFTSGRYLTNPSALTHAALQAARWHAARDFQDALEAHAAVAIPETGIPKGWRAFQPASEKAERATLERGQLLEHGVSTTEHKDLLAEHWNRVLPRAQGTAKMMVPESVAKSVEQEFQRSGRLARNLYDKPMDVWRAAVLKLRPAWLARNIVSQHFLYALGNMGPGGMARYLQSLRVERGDDATRNFVEQALRIPAMRRKYGRVLEDAGLYGVGHASTAAMFSKTAGTRGVLTRGAAWAEEHPATTTVTRTTWNGVKGLANSLATANQKLADDQPRIAQYLKLMRDSPAAARAQKRMLQVAKETGEGVSLMRRLLGPSSEQIAREITPEEHLSLLRQANRVLGDWNTLTPGERKYLRRVVPFAQFYKTIVQVTRDLAVDHPEKVLLLHNLEVAARQNPSIFPSGRMPSWLRGAIAVGPAQGGVQPMIETNIANHFAAPGQLANAALNPLFGVGQGGDTLDLLGPAYDAAMYLGGRNPTTGETYQGTGSNLPPISRALVGVLTGLPQAGLAQEALAGDRIPGTNTRIGAQYPSSLYAPATYTLGGVPISAALAAYLGLPIKNVRLAKAHEYAKEGR
jgi:hypothetical protein